MPRWLGRTVVVLVALAAFVLGLYAAKRPVIPERPAVAGLLWPDPKELVPFELSDHRGDVFDLERLNGRWTFVFFGYTHCPDVCPLTLTVLQEVDRLLASGNPESPSPFQYAFVTVDPKRDTAEHLGDYLGYFDPKFHGVLGEDTALKGLTRQLGVLYIRNDEEAGGDYLVDHTAAVMLVDPRGRLVGIFQAPHKASAIAHSAAKIREFVESVPG